MDYLDADRNGNCRKNVKRVPISVPNRRKENRVDQLLQQPGLHHMSSSPGPYSAYLHTICKKRTMETNRLYYMLLLL